MTENLWITIVGLDDHDIPLFVQDFADWFYSQEENDDLTFECNVVTDE